VKTANSVDVLKILQQTTKKASKKLKQIWVLLDKYSFLNLNYLN
jgi:hypothetical protein